MDTILQGFSSAFHLMVALDPTLLQIIWLSIKVSGGALLLAIFVGLPVGAVLALKRLPLRSLILSVVNTGMGLPPVVVGLFVYLFFSRSGPLGFLALLYTPSAMVIAQFILACPIVTSLSHTAIVNVNPVIRQAARVLGANPLQEALTIIREARYGIITGAIAGLGRVTAEVGAVLMVGGNIAGYTRVMTTTIALETDKGDFALAIALGIILLGMSLVINVALRAFQKLGRSSTGGMLWD